MSKTAAEALPSMPKHPPSSSAEPPSPNDGPRARGSRRAVVARLGEWSWLVVLLLAATLAPAPTSVLAGTTAPTAPLAAPPTQGSVDPSECRAEPRPVEEILVPLATPRAARVAEATPSAGASGIRLPPELPEGPPVDPATATAVHAVWREFWACVNADDLRRQAALLSDDGVRHWVGTEGSVALFAAELVSTQPLPPDDRERVWPLAALRMLPGGRVGGLVDPGGGAAPEYAGKNHVIFVQEDGRWLINDIVTVGG